MLLRGGFCQLLCQPPTSFVASRRQSMFDVKEVINYGIFGARSAAGAWAWCRVVRIADNVIYARVINGSWDAQFSAITGNGIGTAELYKIVFTGPVPDRIQIDYNQVIAYMEKKFAGG